MPRQWARCRVPGCREKIPLRSLMCRPHWRRVPQDLREVWRHAVRDYLEDRNGEALLHNFNELIRMTSW